MISDPQAGVHDLIHTGRRTLLACFDKCCGNSPRLCCPYPSPLSRSLLCLLFHALLLTHSLTHSQPHTHSFSLSYSLPLFLTLSLIHSLIHSRTHSLSNSLTHTLTHSFTHTLT